MRCLFSTFASSFVSEYKENASRESVYLEFGVCWSLCLYVFQKFHLSLGLVSASLPMSFTLFPSLGVSICPPLDTYPSICPCLPLVLACLLFVAWFWVGWDGGFWLLCIC